VAPIGPLPLQLSQPRMRRRAARERVSFFKGKLQIGR
jgi:hypothetical protein